jgi:hypothetical protein
MDNTAVEKHPSWLVGWYSGRHACIMEDPLFDYVKLTDYILSMLHIEIGVGDQLLKMLLDWIDMRPENIREDELDIRDEYYEALMEYKIHDDGWMEWKNLKGTELATLRLERKTLNDRADARQDNNRSFLLPVAERNDIKAQSKEMTAHILVLVSQQSKLQAARRFTGSFSKRVRKSLQLEKRIGRRVACQSIMHLKHSYRSMELTEQLTMTVISPVLVLESCSIVPNIFLRTFKTIYTTKTQPAIRSGTMMRLQMC